MCPFLLVAPCWVTAEGASRATGAPHAQGVACEPPTTVLAGCDAGSVSGARPGSFLRRPSRRGRRHRAPCKHERRGAEELDAHLRPCPGREDVAARAPGTRGPGKERGAEEPEAHLRPCPGGEDVAARAPGTAGAREGGERLYTPFARERQLDGRQVSKDHLRAKFR